MSATRYQNQIQSAVGNALDGILIYVCSQPANTSIIPPTPLATLYTDTSGSVVADNPAISDGNGNFDFYGLPGLYTLVIYDTLQRIEKIVLPDISIFPIGIGSGTVTSVGLSMPTDEFTVTGTPVTSTGTFAVTKVLQNLLTVWSGPLAGPAAVPTFKTLSSLLSAAGVGSGSVTSVAITQSLSALLTGSVSGSPITGAGTITLTVNFANQNANLFLAGPVSGGSGAVTARRFAPADWPLTVSVAYSNSPVFDASLTNSFSITLTGDANFPTIVNGTLGQIIVFEITQDATGSRVFAWPANTRGASAIGTDPNSVNMQAFIFAPGNIWRAVAPGYENFT